MRAIKIWKDPYGEGFDTCKADSITFLPGVSVLVGCNGSGKTTLMLNIQEVLKKEKIPFYYFNNADKETHSPGVALYNEDYELASARISSSEGENIVISLGEFFKNIREFMTTGRIKTKLDNFVESISMEKYQEPTTKERWILLDAIDSGFSIDNIVTVKELLHDICQDAAAQGYILYIVLSVNAYEFADREFCIDVISGQELSFNSYERYKDFILKSEKEKNKRYEKTIKNN